MKHLRNASILLGFALLSACGSSTTAPTVSPTPAPVPCTRGVVFQGSAAIPAHTADFETLTVTSTGRLDVTLDWTLPTSQVGLFVYQGACSFEQFKAAACSFLVSLAGPPKPLKGSVPNLAPGTYGMIIGNASDNDESLAIQAVLSSPTCPAVASVGSRGDPRSLHLEGWSGAW